MNSTKASHLLISLIFVIVCVGLWMIWKLGREVMAFRLGEQRVTNAMAVGLSVYPWLLALPVPALGFSIIATTRGKPTQESVVFYLVVILGLSAFFVLGTAILFGMEAAVLRSPPLGTR